MRALLAHVNNLHALPLQQLRYALLLGLLPQLSASRRMRNHSTALIRKIRRLSAISRIFDYHLIQRRLTLYLLPLVLREPRALGILLFAGLLRRVLIATTRLFILYRVKYRLVGAQRAPRVVALIVLVRSRV